MPVTVPAATTNRVLGMFSIALTEGAQAKYRRLTSGTQMATRTIPVMAHTQRYRNASIISPF